MGPNSCKISFVFILLYLIVLYKINSKNIYLNILRRFQPGGPNSPVLRDVQLLSVNQEECIRRYSELGRRITDNMFCAGWLDIGGRDQCRGDSGGAVVHNNVVVGITSWGEGCAHERYPGVNVRVSRFTSWIVSQAMA